MAGGASFHELGGHCAPTAASGRHRTTGGLGAAVVNVEWTPGTKRGRKSHYDLAGRWRVTGQLMQLCRFPWEISDHTEVLKSVSHRSLERTWSWHCDLRRMLPRLLPSLQLVCKAPLAHLSRNAYNYNIIQYL